MAAQVGVELVVKGLASFKSSMSQAQAYLQMFRPKITLVERAFQALGNTIKGFAEGAVRTLSITIGVLLRDAVRSVINTFGEMINTIVEATAEFQRLEIRLNQFNLNTLMESGLSFNEAMEKSIKLTEEQLNWTIKLAKSSPYDATDVATSYSLARSYGFVDDKAKELTDSILDFSSGMGLENTAIERIVTNFGQMMQQGKITGTELRDLARGSFVPVNKILGMVADNLGMTTEELNKMRKAGTAKPEWFIDAFIELVNKDFAGASEKMARTLQFAKANLKDLFVGLPALKIVKPIFDAIGGSLGNIVEAFSGAKYESLVAVFTRIGTTLSNIVTKIMGLAPSAGNIADLILKVFNNIANWLDANQNNIVDWAKNAIDFLKEIGNTIKNDVVPWVKNELIPAFEKFGKWWDTNGETVIQIVKNLTVAFLAWEAASMFVRLALGIAINFIGMLVSAIPAAFTALFLLHAAILTVINIILFLPGIVIGALILFVKYIADHLEEAKQWFVNFGDSVVRFFRDFNWSHIGRYLVDGLINGIVWAAEGLFKVVSWLANSAVNIFNSIFGIHSPSVVMEETGKLLMEGLANGIDKGMEKTTAVAKSAADTVAGALTGAKVGAYGVTTTGTRDYLGNTGDVMRSTLTETTGKDPCAKGSIGGCVADKIGSALGGVGTAIGGIGAALMGMLNEVKITEETNRRDFLESMKDLTSSNNENIAILRRDTLESIKDVTVFAEREVVIARRDALEELKDTGTNIEFTASQKLQIMVDNFSNYMHEKALALQTFMQGLVQSFLNILPGVNTGTSSSGRSNSPTQISYTPPSVPLGKGSPKGGSSGPNVLNVSNTFNNQPAGSRISWDYENSQFWV